MTHTYTPRVAFIGREETKRARISRLHAFGFGIAAACAVLVPLHTFDIYFRQMDTLSRERKKAFETARALFGQSEKALWYYQHRNLSIKKAEEECLRTYPRSAAAHRWLLRQAERLEPQRITTSNILPEEIFPGHGRVRDI